MDNEPFVYTAGVVVPRDVTSLIIGGSVTVVAPFTFYYYRNLRRVELQEGVEEIGREAFFGCYKLTRVDCRASSLRTIGYKAFAGCPRLLEVNLLEDIRRIEAWAFAGCDLGRITIPSSVVEIGKRAFADCYSLEEVTLAGGMVMVAGGAFFRCPRLERISIFSVAIVVDDGAFSWLGDGRVAAVTGGIERNPAGEPNRLVLASPHLGSMRPGDLTDLTDTIERIADATQGAGGLLDLAAGDVSSRIRDCFADRLSTWHKREVATLLELRLWKIKLFRAREAGRSRAGGAGVSTRDDCRRTCGADPVVELVLSSLVGPHRRAESREEDAELLALRSNAKYDWVSLRDDWVDILSESWVDILRDISRLMVALFVFLPVVYWFERHFPHGQ